MIIAEQKKKENIAEYILYMYQVEDMIRANQLDIDSIEKTLINKFEVPYEVKRDMREWYKSLIDMMQDEGKQEKGHLNFLQKQVEQLHALHHEILSIGIDMQYKQTYEKARSHIEALRMKAGYSKENDIQMALNGLYGLLLLKLQKARITEETTKAFDSIRELIAELSARYMEKGAG